MLYALIGHVKTTRFTGGYYYYNKNSVNKSHFRHCNFLPNTI